MKLGIFYRAVRYLTAEQWFFRFWCRGRRLYMRYFPQFSRARLNHAAEQLAFPDLSSSQLTATARHVIMLQEAVHNHYLEDIVTGRFTLLNRTVDFGHLDNITWRRDLGEANNPLWRMNLAYMGYAVPILAKGKPSGLMTVLTILRSLEAQNSWSVPGVFRDVWASYTVSHRLINLLCGLVLYRQAGGNIAQADEQEILNHLRFCAAFIRHNLERELQFNHLLKNYVALVVYSSGLPKPNFELLRLRVPKSIQQQILADGGHVERSPMYHLLALLDLYILRDSGVFQEEWLPHFNTVIPKMERALALLSHPDGDIALFNDAWLREAPRSCDVINGTVGLGKNSLSDTGYVRLDNGKAMVIFDCGSCGPLENPGHAHADFLSVEVSVGGARFIIDPGVPTYTAGHLRDISRSASAHNGPHLTGHEPIEFWHSFRVGRRGYAEAIESAKLDFITPLWCAGWQSGYTHLGVKVYRYVGLFSEALLIADIWIGKTEIPAASHFLIPEYWNYEQPYRFSHRSMEIKATSIVGQLGVVQPAQSWSFFGVEQAGLRLPLFPEKTPRGSCAAVLFSWSNYPPIIDSKILYQLFESLNNSKGMQ